MTIFNHDPSLKKISSSFTFYSLYSDKVGIFPKNKMRIFYMVLKTSPKKL